MKKIIIFLIAVIIIVFAIGKKYYSYKVDYITVNQENSEYDQYINDEIYGIDLATAINKTVDKNIRNKVEIAEDGTFIQNEESSIEIEIYMKDNETTYKMETIYNNGTEQFIQYYGNIKFKCSKTEYHESTGKLSYMLFEQI